VLVQQPQQKLRHAIEPSLGQRQEPSGVDITAKPNELRQGHLSRKLNWAT
jgi:hypothetical protein